MIVRRTVGKSQRDQRRTSFLCKNIHHRMSCRASIIQLLCRVTESNKVKVQQKTVKSFLSTYIFWYLYSGQVTKFHFHSSKMSSAILQQIWKYWHQGMVDLSHWLKYDFEICFQSSFYTTCAMSIMPYLEVKNLQHLKTALHLYA